MFENIRKNIAFWLYPPKTVPVNANEIAQAVRLQKERDALVVHCKELEARLATPPDPKNLMRQLMGGITLDMDTQENYLIPLTVEEIREFNKWGWEQATNRWWQYLVRWAINNQAAKTIGEIPKDRDATLFGAGRIDGLMLLRDEVDNRKVAHESDTQKPEPYDADKIIQDN